MDVNSLYNNIDDEEGPDACYKKLETRKNKTSPSNTLKNCILLILKPNILWFCNTFHIHKGDSKWVLQWLLIMQTYSWVYLKHHFLMPSTEKLVRNPPYGYFLSMTYSSFGQTVKYQFFIPLYHLKSTNLTYHRLFETRRCSHLP